MNRNGIWMRLYPGDYMRDTIGLTHAQHGAYLLAIMKYWSKGESLTQAEFREVCGRERNRIAQFFVWEGNRWHHKRIDEELAACRERMEKARLKARQAAVARWGKNVDSGL